MFKLTVHSSFSAAHRLVDYSGACQRIHGHNWKVRATIASDQLDDLGMVMDLYELETILNSTLKKFDHYIINDIEPFTEINPTSENLAKFIYYDIKKQLSAPIKMVQVELLETDDFSVTFAE